MSKKGSEMKTTIDYAASEAPSFDAVEDVKDYLGSRYDAVASEMKRITDCEQFAMWCAFAGIEGFPVRAWYEHFHGAGTWQDQ